eukprot:Seg1817.15 transcript_id=Seg1817.15/GoldUCD/mRNA.D3Y31 product="Ubiquitin-like protein 4A" protein_id=Seg1817.15/GoldUCD/D3Y31
MNLIIKVLNGNEEFNINLLENSSKILELKELIHKQRGVLVSEQRLLFKGRALTDEGKTLGEYGITENSKLHLSIKKSSENASKSAQNSLGTIKGPDFNKRLEEVLKKHFHPQDADKVLQKFNELYGSMIEGMSLDDFERIAKYEMKKQTK